jgi:[ribosomal protein S5]-alanine N-acetyltransferase
MFFKDLETDRLILKSISSEDRDLILEQFSDDTINHYLFDSEPLSNLEEADEIIDFYIQPEPRAQHRWIIILKSNDSKIGTCGFHCWDKTNSSVDIGYDLQKEYWGQGIMTEALQEILSFALHNMGVTRIDAHIYVDNQKSVAIAQKLGLKWNGNTEMCVFRGKEYPHHIFSLDCSAIK